MSFPQRRDGFLPIGDYGLIGDGHTAALVGRDGSIDWLCWPRFDSASVFGRILGRGGGHFRVAVAGATEATRRYRPATAVLETTLTAPGGQAVLTDCLAVDGGEDGRPRSGKALVRSVRCAGGAVTVEIDFCPRPGYGAERPRMERVPSGVVAESPSGKVTLSSTAELRVDGPAARGMVELAAGQRADLVARRDEPPRTTDADAVDELIDSTARWWRRWLSASTYEGPFRDAVERSALTLKMLDYAPTGAIVAAPTTSLPERIGGVRNWDYRYAWIRDVAFSVYALRRIGFGQEAEDFLDWTFATARCRPEELQLMYGIEGGRDLPERVLDHLEGYRGSAPVRVGNAAAGQLQLDSVGELLDCLHQREAGDAEMTPSMWQCIRAHVDWLAEHWERPDHGIWEVRSSPQRFTYSAAMAHVAFDRAVRAAERNGLAGASVRRWREERDRSVGVVTRDAWSEELGAFAQTVGGSEPDASALALPLRRVVDAEDPRMRSTVKVVRERLGAGNGLLYRYLGGDGLPGHQGAFLICSFWLVDCLAGQGDLDEAGHLYEGLLGRANDLGLLSEEVDPGTGEALGNFPQAFSHIGVIASAVNLARARR
ncbi:MAG: glycoside hydrolase family 15 protein [Actinomycetota bacterium]|nr:glycoside hydrolase family 15 protein [Actinomycetota bacterium]